MAKEDFCFTYYDGDALRDMSHMNRLERGAYNDIVLQQRKFGRLSMEQIKKVLGKDFDTCWESVSLVMVVEDGKYFIDWLEKSILKMRKHAKKQSDNVTKRYQPDTKSLPNEPTVTPLEDENGNEKVFIKKIKECEEKVTDIEEKLLSLDEIWIDKLRPKWAHIEFDIELMAFQEKVRGSPEDYADHDTGGIRKAFIYQLTRAKKKTGNGKSFSKNDRTEFNQNELAIIQRHASGFE